MSGPILDAKETAYEGEYILPGVHASRRKMCLDMTSSLLERQQEE